MREYFVWLAKFITILLVVFIAVPVLIGVFVGIASVLNKDGVAGDDKHQVAVIELKGEIVSAKEVLEQLYKQAENKKVKGIVLRIDSPGGAVAPSQDIYNAVKKIKLKKPVIASMGSLAASGGFYSALSATKVFCEPGTLTGSIGVIMQVPNFTKIAEKIGFDMVTVKSGKFKDVGNSFREMTPEDKAFLEMTIKQVYDEFLNAVIEGRKIERSKALEFADGRVIVGSEAKRLGLVDEFGDVYDAARAVFDVLGEPLPDGEIPKLYYPEDKFGDLKKILQSIDSVILSLNPMSPKADIRYIMQ